MEAYREPKATSGYLFMANLNMQQLQHTASADEGALLPKQNNFPKKAWSH